RRIDELIVVACEQAVPGVRKTAGQAPLVRVGNLNAERLVFAAHDGGQEVSRGEKGMRRIDVTGPDGQVVGIDVEIEVRSGADRSLDPPGVLASLLPLDGPSALTGCMEALYVPRELTHHVRTRGPDRQPHLGRRWWIIDFDPDMHEVCARPWDAYAVADG